MGPENQVFLVVLGDYMMVLEIYVLHLHPWIKLVVFVCPPLFSLIVYSLHSRFSHGT